MDDTPTTLLVAERDEPVREFLVDQLLADGFAASGAGGLEEARVKLASFQPELLVLGELEGPREQLGLLRGIRSRGHTACPCYWSVRTAASWRSCAPSRRAATTTWPNR